MQNAPHPAAPSQVFSSCHSFPYDYLRFFRNEIKFVKIWKYRCHVLVGVLVLDSDGITTMGIEKNKFRRYFLRGRIEEKREECMNMDNAVDVFR